MRGTRTILIASLVTACGTAGTGSSGSTSSGGAAPDAGPSVKFSEIYAELFPTDTNARCNFCHGLHANQTSNGNLGMGTDQATAYAALVNKASISTACKDKVLVVPGNPDSSLFLQKLLENPVCGSRMPLGGNLLTDTQRGRVRRWIADGARND